MQPPSEPDYRQILIWVLREKVQARQVEACVWKAFIPLRGSRARFIGPTAPTPRRGRSWQPTAAARRRRPLDFP